MKKYFKGILTTASIISIIFVIGWSTGLHCQNNKDLYSETRRNIQIYGEIYKETFDHYVEDIDPEAFMRSGINGMLDKLDPYTVYLEKEGKENLKLMTEGKYYGVGMRITIRNGWPTCAEQPFPNSPAQKAGIREGDQIIEINGESTKGLSLNETASRLRGEEKGSKVTIKIRRVGIEKPIQMTLIRDEIVISDIQYKGMVEPGIGLINLNVFNRGAAKQVRNALEELLNQGMEALILDLRGNPGGLLDVAVDVASNFLNEGELVVYTKGRSADRNKEYHTSGTPIFSSMPLVILVNQYSASASEIVAGAVQDLDRGVVIGTETFGKGLVQSVIPLDRRGEKQLKMTTAKYYLPSGRLIQRPEVFERGKGSVFLDTGSDSSETDSVNHESYYTENGRRVRGGGGVKPDIKSKNPKTTRYVSMLRYKSMFFNFSLKYAADHEDLSRDFEVDDEMLDTFFEFVDENDFDYKPAGMAELDSLENIAKNKDYSDQFIEHLGNVRKQFESVEKEDREESIDDIKYMIKRELTAKLFGNDASYVTSFKRDETLQEAVSLLKEKQRYENILTPNSEGN